MRETYKYAWDVLTSPLRFKEITAPTAAQISANNLALYAKDRVGVSGLYYMDDAGVEHDLGALTTPQALTRVNDTNVTLTLGGTPATALLQAVSLTLGWTGSLAETRGGTAQTTYTKGDTLYSSAANTLAKLAGNTTTTLKVLTQTGDGVNSAAPVWQALSALSGAALTKTDDTNVTLTLGGSPTSALLAATSLTLGWTGQLGLARGGTHADLSATGGAGQVLKQTTLGGNVTVATVAASEIASGQALTRVDDTNVTLTLGGTPLTALLTAASITVGWSGTLSAARGGTGLGSYSVGDLLYASASNAFSKLTDVAAGSYLRSGGTNTAPLWSTLILPNAATANRIVYASSTNTYGESANLAYDGTDFLLGSGTRARMSGQNRFRYLNAMVRVTKSGNQSINSATATAVTWDTEDFDTDSMHEGVTNPSRLTAPIAGKYLVYGIAQWVIDATGSLAKMVGFYFYKNGSIFNLGNFMPNGTGTIGTICTGTIIINLAANDYMEMYVYQESGGAINLLGGSVNSSFGMEYIGE